MIEASMSIIELQEMLADEYEAQRECQREEAAKEERRQIRIEREKDKPYGYEVKAGAVKESLARWNAPPSHDVILHRTGTEAQVRRWADRHLLPGKERLVVVEIYAMKPLTRGEYQDIKRRNPSSIPYTEAK